MTTDEQNDGKPEVTLRPAIEIIPVEEVAKAPVFPVPEQSVLNSARN